MSSENDGGLSYSNFYLQATEQLLVTNEAHFQTLLTEFKDHQTFEIKRTDEGDMYSIPLPSESLEQVVAALE